MKPVPYDSADDGKIYQTKSVYSKPSFHPLKGWTETELGYINEARQWASCVLRNRRLMKRPYTWAVHINLNREYPVGDIGPMWKKVVRKLEGQGVVALWVREPNRLNKLHYHLIVKSEIGEKELLRAIEQSMPPRSEVQWRKRVEPVINEWRLSHYVFKAKVRGHDKRGVLRTDLYRPKRLLFKPHLPFRKVGTIGDFWEQEKSKTAMWQDIRDIEKRISDGLARPYVERLCRHIYDFYAGTARFREIRRHYGYYADEPFVQNWIESLADEWAEEDAAVG